MFADQESPVDILNFKPKGKLTARKSTAGIVRPAPLHHVEPVASSDHNNPDTWEKIVSHRGHSWHTEYLVQIKGDASAPVESRQHWFGLDQVKLSRLDLLEAYRKDRRLSYKLTSISKKREGQYGVRGRPRLKDSDGRLIKRHILPNPSPHSSTSSPLYASMPAKAKARKLSLIKSFTHFTHTSPTSDPGQYLKTSGQSRPEVKHMSTQVEPHDLADECNQTVPRITQKHAKEMSTQTDLTYFIWDTVL